VQAAIEDNGLGLILRRPSNPEVLAFRLINGMHRIVIPDILFILSE